jgi:hypothetical protein
LSTEDRTEEIVAKALSIIAKGPVNPQEATIALLGPVEALRLASEHDDDWNYALQAAAYAQALREVEGEPGEKKALTVPGIGGSILA